MTIPKDTPYDLRRVAWAMERMRICGVPRDQRKLIASQLYWGGWWKGHREAMAEYEGVMDAARAAMVEGGKD